MGDTLGLVQIGEVPLGEHEWLLGRALPDDVGVVTPAQRNRDSGDGQETGKAERYTRSGHEIGMEPDSILDQGVAQRGGAERYHRSHELPTHAYGRPEDPCPDQDRPVPEVPRVRVPPNPLE